MADEVVGLGSGERAQFGGNEAEARRKLRDCARCERLKLSMIDLVDEYWMAWKAPIRGTDLGLRFVRIAYAAGSSTTELLGEMVVERRVHRLLSRRGLGFYMPYALWHAMDGHQQLAVFDSLPRGNKGGRLPYKPLG